MLMLPNPLCRLCKGQTWMVVPYDWTSLYRGDQLPTVEVAKVGGGEVEVVEAEVEEISEAVAEEEEEEVSEFGIS